MIDQLRARNEWKFAGVLPRADRALAADWWTALALRGLLPAGFAVAMGWLVGAALRGGDIAAPPESSCPGAGRRRSARRSGARRAPSPVTGSTNSISAHLGVRDHARRLERPEPVA